MWICLLYLFMSASVLFCLFSAWLKSFLSLGIQAPPQMAYIGLSPRGRNPEVFIPSFWCGINIWNETFPSLPTKEWESCCVFAHTLWYPRMLMIVQRERNGIRGFLTIIDSSKYQNALNLL